MCDDPAGYGQVNGVLIRSCPERLIDRSRAGCLIHIQIMSRHHCTRIVLTHLLQHLAF
jgi:hypothetical protein